MVFNILFLFLLCHQWNFLQAAVTYELETISDNDLSEYQLHYEKFAHNMLSYISAKQLALQLGLKFLYVPFEYSDQLKLHRIEKVATEKEIELFTEKVIYNKKEASGYINRPNTLYITQWDNKPILDMYNEEIKKTMKTLFLPLAPLPLITFAPDAISVAVHIVVAKEYETKKKLKNPHLFAPFHYFADQISRILYMFPNQKIHIELFTDYKDPDFILMYLKNKVPSSLITYTYTKTENLLEDFFNMMKFDVLIRPASIFSGLAQYLGNHKVVIFPEEIHFINDQAWYVDTVQVVTKINGHHKIFGNVRSSQSEMPITIKN